MTLTVAFSLLLLALLLSASPMLSMPIGMVAAMFALTYETPLSQSAVICAGGIALGRVLLAYQARRGAGTNAANDAIGQMLRSRPEYRRLTFMAGFVPFFPARFLFPLLGRMKAPIFWAALGTLFGQYLVVLLTSWVARAIGRALTSTEKDAGSLLGVLAITWVIYALITNIDWHALRTSNTLRFKEAQRGPFGGSFDIFGGAAPGGESPFGNSPFGNSPFGGPGNATRIGRDVPDDPFDDDSVIEAEVIREDHDDDSSDSPSSGS